MTKSIIVAYDKNRAIGNNNELLWRFSDLPRDMEHFRELTLNTTVIMGRKTLESIGRALPKRRNIVVSTGMLENMPGVEIASSLPDAYMMSADDPQITILGGGQIYEQAIADVDTIYATEVDATFDADTYFPVISDAEWIEKIREHHDSDDNNKFNLDFVKYERKTR